MELELALSRLDTVDRALEQGTPDILGILSEQEPGLVLVLVSALVLVLERVSVLEPVLVLVLVVVALLSEVVLVL